MKIKQGFPFIEALKLTDRIARAVTLPVVGVEIAEQQNNVKCMESRFPFEKEMEREEDQRTGPNPDFLSLAAWSLLYYN